MMEDRLEIIRRGSLEPPERWGLALSGGGFRAALYHLGVIRALRQCGRLTTISDVASVSGGSVVAAHLVLNWSRYTGTDEEFDEAADELVRFIASDVRGRIVRAWLFRHVTLFPALTRWRRSRLTALLEQQYARLFGRKTLGDLAIPGAPRLHMLATSFTSGQACSFGNAGFVTGIGLPSARTIDTDLFRISAAVAASSAFPPIFPPVALTRKMLKASEEMFPHTQYLGDGGVFDNLGIRALCWLHTTGAEKFTSVVLSDAGAQMDARFGRPYRFIVSRSARASDVLMQRVSDLEYDEIAHRLGLPEQRVMRMRIDEALPDSNPLRHQAEVQRAAAQLRTDLDTFSSHEINVLVQHGYAVAIEKLRGTNVSECWLPLSTRNAAAADDLKLVEHLERGADHRLRLWSWRDASSWALVVVMLLVMTVAGLWVYRVRRAAEEEREINRRLIASLRSERDASRHTIDVLARAARHDDVSVATLQRIFAPQQAAVVSIASSPSKESAGFFVGRRGEILTTASAVPANQNTITVTLADGTNAEAALVKKDDTIDLALLRIDRETTPIALSTNPPVTGTTGISIPPAGSDDMGSAEVTSVEPRKIVWHALNTDDVRSLAGAPLLGPDGRVTGIGLDANSAVPSAVAAQFVESVSSSIVTTTNPDPP